MNRAPIGVWVEAMRLRTLPVSCAGVITAWALAWRLPSMRWLPAALCLAFAVLCQIASNFANEYYDYRDGLDKPGREGPRRGVTEGDIKPRAMLTATFITLAVASVLGLWLIRWGGWWLIIVGATIATGALAYSAGPYPLSRHALGEVAVLLFFGIVPVNFTYYLATGFWTPLAGVYSIAIGLMASNVLIVNNYRDADDDKAVGKVTLANKFGRGVARNIYLANGIVAAGLVLLWVGGNNMLWPACVIYIPVHLMLWWRLNLKHGEPAGRLNPLLGLTAGNMLLFAVITFI